jgi:PDZ domain-containing protein
MFAIGIIDKLTPGALTNGKIIAGTGTITPDGTVGDIGGIQQKLIGARDAGAVLFLAPQGNCQDVIGHIPEGLTVAAIETLEDAMEAIEAFNSGAEVTACS